MAQGVQQAGLEEEVELTVEPGLLSIRKTRTCVTPLNRCLPYGCG